MNNDKRAVLKHIFKKYDRYFDENFEWACGLGLGKDLHFNLTEEQIKLIERHFNFLINDYYQIIQHQNEVLQEIEEVVNEESE